MKRSFLFLLSCLLISTTCWADAGGCEKLNPPTPTTAAAQANTNAANYQAIKAKLLAGCDNIDQALKDAEPTIKQIATEAAAARALESDFVKAANAKATDADLDKLVSQYTSHINKLATLLNEYKDKLDPTFTALFPALEWLVIAANQPNNPISPDQKLIQRLNATRAAYVAPIQQASSLLTPIKQVILAQQLHELPQGKDLSQGVDPGPLNEQSLPSAMRRSAAQVILGEKVIESTTPELTAENFDDTIKNSKLPVLVYFGSTWSKPSREMVPKIIQAAQDYRGKILVVRVDADQNLDLVEKYRIFYLPTTMLIYNVPGKELTSVREGLMKYNELTSFIDTALPAPK